MSDYSSKKVAELKELLSARGLAVSGNKADLVARLEEADKAIPADKAAATAEAGAAADAAVDAAVEETSSATATAPEVIEVAKTEESAPAADAAAAAAAAATKETPSTSTEAITVEDDVEETVVELSDEDKQKQAIEDLEKQIKRKKRFATGDNDADIAELEKQLERIKRFGVTAVATNDLSLDKGLDTLAKGRRKESGKVRRESVSAKDKNTAHPYNKSENGLKPGVKIATVDEEKIKARQARFFQ
ncbi:YALI0F08965p [Yarrowia lipolytica CLIB122]|uniref:YALI0F08965p n=1 Tax=Yarrowia lipolytica (strain CLIB 122 / E 150) TaxID=284591 RepID=Q6C2C7_YARLI|nr:YALI0F08965p [Yarrowia lipolytica CLIB122]CAG77992.1 YALI0F08965p [Yarrowia lipolytica CLIB122]|eukprot:XP_505185.1 YALI0F08965p [Yarrowia lipolytica CLIB122]